MALQKTKWVYPVPRNPGFEEINENRDGVEVFFDLPAGVPILSPLNGIVDHMEAGSGGYILGIRHAPDGAEGDQIVNYIHGIAKPVAFNTVVTKGQQIGVAGSGDWFGFDMKWTCWLNFADDSDADGTFVNPIELAESMGGINYASKLEQRLEVAAAAPTLPSANLPIISTYDMSPPPADNKKMVMIGVAALATWYFMKKGKK